MAALNDLLKFSLELEDQAREAWHPVSDPPLDEPGKVLVRFSTGELDVVPYWHVPHYIQEDDYHAQWARISDVLLMPEGEGDAK